MIGGGERLESSVSKLMPEAGIEPRVALARTCSMVGWSQEPVLMKAQCVVASPAVSLRKPEAKEKHSLGKECAGTGSSWLEVSS